MSTRVFILDWQGTLDMLSNPKRFLIELREKNPGCFICINSGSFPNMIADELGVADLSEVVDDFFQKRTVKFICRQITNHPDSINTVDNPVVLGEVIICDDQDRNAWAYEDLQEELGVPFKLFNSVTAMEDAL